MTSPFQSIIGTAEVGEKVEGNDNSYLEEAAEDIRASELPANSIAPKEPPLGLIQLSAGIETGLCAAAKKAPGVVALPPQQRKSLLGGVYSPDKVLELLNAHYLIGKSEQEVAVFRIKDDGFLAFMPPEQFKLDVANILVQRPGRSSPIPAEKFWKESPHRHQREIVFKPGGTTTPSEFNQWRGFGVESRKGRKKLHRLIRHIREVICRCDRAKFKYLMRLLAWMVQNPGKHAGVILVLKSSKQGTGKTTLGNVMLDIFGRHGARIDDKDRLLGQFNDWLETICFALLEEATWAGDHRAADKLKSLVTGDTLQVERKFGACRQVPNRLKTIATTNHDHAVHAGVQDRRNVVYDVSDARVGDKAWFDKLYQDLAEGGTSEFLYLLQHVQLGDWHPARDFLKTAETAEQQRMSGDSISQWAQACIHADAIVGAGRGPYGTEATHDLGTPISVEALREAYTGFCKQNSLRALSTDGFGKACADMFGPRKRLKALQSNATGNGKRRPWGYHVLKGNKWQEKVDARLGVKN